MSRFRILLGALLLVAVAACTAGVSPPTSEPGTAAPNGSEPPAIADGESFGWVRGIEGELLLIDPAELLTGEEARRAAIEDGLIAEGEDLPNDFYISDPSDETITVPLAGNAIYRLLLFAEGTPTETEVSIDEVVAALAGSNPDVYGVADGVFPATITVEGGQVTEVVQVYLP